MNRKNIFFITLSVLSFFYNSMHAVGDTQDCSICLEALEQDVMTLTPCGHAYHRDCIGQWARAGRSNSSLCPYCRQAYDQYAQLLNNADDANAENIAEQQEQTDNDFAGLFNQFNDHFAQDHTERDDWDVHGRDNIEGPLALIAGGSIMAIFLLFFAWLMNNKNHSSQRSQLDENGFNQHVPGRRQENRRNLQQWQNQRMYGLYQPANFGMVY